LKEDLESLRSLVLNLNVDEEKMKKNDELVEKIEKGLINQWREVKL